MKTEFLVQLDGAGTKAKDVILVVGVYRYAMHDLRMPDSTLYVLTELLSACHKVLRTDRKSWMKQRGDDS